MRTIGIFFFVAGISLIVAGGHARLDQLRWEGAGVAAELIGLLFFKAGITRAVREMEQHRRLPRGGEEE